MEYNKGEQGTAGEQSDGGAEMRVEEALQRKHMLSAWDPNGLK